VDDAATDTCAFCKRSRAEVHALVMGPAVNICDQCVRRAADLLVRELPARPIAVGAPHTRSRVRRWWAKSRR